MKYEYILLHIFNKGCCITSLNEYILCCRYVMKQTNVQAIQKPACGLPDIKGCATQSMPNVTCPAALERQFGQHYILEWIDVYEKTFNSKKIPAQIYLVPRLYLICALLDKISSQTVVFHICYISYIDLTPGTCDPLGGMIRRKVQIYLTW